AAAAPRAPPARTVRRPAAARRDRAGARDEPRTRVRRRAHGQPRLAHRARGARPAARREHDDGPVDRDGDARPDRGELRRPHRVPRRRPRRRRPPRVEPGGDLVVHALARGGGMTAVRRQVASILVAALAASFGVALLQITGALAAVIGADDVTGSSGTVVIMLQILAFVFIVIAV